MARPIVLTSNLIPDLKPNIGALANVYTNPDPVRRDPTVENEDGTFTIPTYQRTVIDIPDDFDWSMYGRAGPTLRYFNRVRTGEIQYDPNNDVVDPSTLTDPADPNAPPLPTEAEMIRQELIGVGTQLAAGVGAQIGRSVAANVTGEGINLGSIPKGISDFSSNFKGMDVFSAPKTGPAAKVRFSPGSDNAEVASLNKQISDNQVSTTDALLNPEGAKANIDAAKQAATTRAGLLKTGETGIFSGMYRSREVWSFWWGSYSRRQGKLIWVHWRWSCYRSGKPNCW